MEYWRNVLRIGLLITIFGVFNGNTYAQSSGQWIWSSGDSVANAVGHYGTRRVADSRNRPPSRDSYATWTDAAGNFWLFGGKDAKGSYYNDMWKYNPVARQWTWVTGDSVHNGSLARSRVGSLLAGDTKGNIWIFGGYGINGEGTLGYLNDLWVYATKYDAWAGVVPSSTSGNYPDSGNYGIQGTPAASNWPGPRAYMWGSIDTLNNLWIFGGNGFDQHGHQGLLNDLWKYNLYTYTATSTSPGQWTWMNGNSLAGESPNFDGFSGSPGGTYGSPGGTDKACGGFDSKGNIWIFGGEGVDDMNNYFALLNQLWQYNIGSNSWAFFKGQQFDDISKGSYGKKGVPASGNLPPGRYAACGGVDKAGNFWVFGGFGFGTHHSTIDTAGSLGDLWEYSSGTWTWVGGDSGRNIAPVFGSQGNIADADHPGGRVGAGAWIDAAAHFWMMGGTDRTNPVDPIGDDKNDLWEFNASLSSAAAIAASSPGQWTWISGDDTANARGIYTGSLTQPGARDGHWGGLGVINSPSLPSEFMIFGGNGYDGSGTHGYLNDTWLFDNGSQQWTFIRGATQVDQGGKAGVAGATATGYSPGARSGQAACADKSGNAWVFGGTGYDVAGNYDTLNDLWGMRRLQWGWMGGDLMANQSPPAYGIQGTQTKSNKPGYRYGASASADAAGNIWIFGGNGIDSNSKTGDLNDLWKFAAYPTLQWTWEGGSSTGRGAPNYNHTATADPGARENACTWFDAAGTLWLFGGYSKTQGYFNDLWSFNTTTRQWTWMDGPSTIAGHNNAGVYGTMGQSGSTNTPGARRTQTVVIDGAGNFWLYGGEGYDGTGTFGVLGDLWKYNPTTRQWTWMSGDNVVAAGAIYGAKGISNVGNKPGGRQSAPLWIDHNGNLWLMGGLDLSNQDNNDLWEFTPNQNAALPIKEVQLEGVADGSENSLTWQTIGELNTSSFEVQRSTGGADFSDIGSVAAQGRGDNSYAYTDTRPPGSSVYIYRLKMQDLDGSFTYSNTILLHVIASAGLSLYPNPAGGSVTLQMMDDSRLNTTVQLLDMSGRLIRELIITGRDQTIDLSNIAHGIYLLRLADGTTLKLLKK